MSTRSVWMSDAWGEPEVAAPARQVAGDVEGSLELARSLERTGRAVGTDTWRVLSALATLGSVDLTTARVVEPHLDAVAILEQAGERGADGATWGVFAASPPGTDDLQRHGRSIPQSPPPVAGCPPRPG